MTIPVRCAHASYNYLLVNGRRRLTPRENLRLMGFPDDFKIVVPDSAVRRQAGNSVVIPVIEAVARHMVAAMRQQALPTPYPADAPTQLARLEEYERPAA